MLIDLNNPKIYPGNMAHAAGEVYYAGAINVEGSVSGKFNLVADGDIVIDGDASETSMQAAGNLVIRGKAISVERKMRLFARGDMWLNSPTNITAEATGDIIVTGNVKKSQIYANGQITMLDGMVSDSCLIGTDGLWITSAISSSPNATRLIAGISFNDQERYKAIVEQIKKNAESQRQMMNEIGDILFKLSSGTSSSRKPPPKDLKDKMIQLRMLMANLENMQTMLEKLKKIRHDRVVIVCEKTLGVGINICLIRNSATLDQPVVGPVSLFVESTSPNTISRQNSVLLARQTKEYVAKV